MPAFYKIAAVSPTSFSALSLEKKAKSILTKKNFRFFNPNYFIVCAATSQNRSKEDSIVIMHFFYRFHRSPCQIKNLCVEQVYPPRRGAAGQAGAGGSKKCIKCHFYCSVAQ